MSFCVRVQCMRACMCVCIFDGMNVYSTYVHAHLIG